MLAYKWWEGLGREGLTALVKNAPLSATNPVPVTIDFTTVTNAKFRYEPPNNATPVYWTAAILGTPTANAITFQRIFLVGDLTVGDGVVTGMVSTDAGTTWYVTGRNTLTVRP